MDNDVPWLYALLLDMFMRPEVNISHRRMPLAEEHVKFWNSKPYEIANVIMVDGWLAGYWYLTRNLHEIGIKLFEKYDTLEINGKVLDHVLANMDHKEFLANVNPNHAELVMALNLRGFEICQHTYRLTR